MWIPNWQCSTLWCFASLCTRNNSIFKGHVIYPSDYVVIYSLLSYLFIRSLPHTVYIMYLTNTQEQILRIVTGHCLCNMPAIIIINQSNKLSLVKYYNYLPSRYLSKLRIFSQGLMYMNWVLCINFKYQNPGLLWCPPTTLPNCPEGHHFIIVIFNADHVEFQW